MEKKGTERINFKKYFSIRKGKNTYFVEYFVMIRLLNNRVIYR